MMGSPATASVMTTLAVGFSRIDERTPNPASNAVMIGGVLCGLVSLGVAIGFTAAAPGNHYDAINLYNNAVERRLRQPKAPPPVAPDTPPKPVEDGATP